MVAIYKIQNRILKILNNYFCMLTTQKIEQIKIIYLDPELSYKDILAKCRKIFNRQIAYSTLLTLIRKEGTPNRKKQKIRFKTKCQRCKYSYELCLCDGIAHG